MTPMQTLNTGPEPLSLLTLRRRPVEAEGAAAHAHRHGVCP